MFSKLSTLKMAAVALATSVAIGLAPAAAVTLNFEGFASGTVITTQYASQGAIFSNGATVLTPGVVLTSIFPPSSGTNVVFNNASSTLRVNAVGSLFRTAGGFVTGNTVVTLRAFSFTNVLLGSVSTPGANFTGAGTGVLPNFFLNFSAPNIAYVTFTGASGGEKSFTLDDFTFTTTEIPEPSPLVALLLLGATSSFLGYIRKQQLSA